HSALRSGVVPEGTMDEDGLQRLEAALDDAIAAGAVGMSSSRGSNHTDANGLPMPSRLASDEELRRLVARAPGRVWQINIASKGDRSEAGIAKAIAELDSYATLARETGTRFTWTPLVVGPGDRVAYRRLLDFSTENADVIIPQISAQSISSAISFDGPSFASMIEGWAVAFAGYGDLPKADKLARLVDPEFRALLRASREDPSKITAPNFSRWRLAASPTAPELFGLTLTEIGERLGKSPSDAMLDLAVADDLMTVIEAPLSNLAEDDVAVRELVAAPTTLIGLGDAGAHVKSITNYTYPSYVLGDLANKRGWITVSDAIRRMTSVPAETLGLKDRGTVRVGAHADLCVIDLDRLGAKPAALVADLPGGASRLHADATGYRAVIVNGVPVVVDDQLTTSRTGQLVRAQS
ncbi:MAG TPA: amidohydrolase family protein, partial [Ilumatobacteraceae bacterium]